MRNCIIPKGNLLHRLPRRFGCLTDRFGDFVGLAKSDSNRSIVIAGHDQCAEAESPAAFYDLGATIDEYHLLGGIALSCRSLIGVPFLPPTLVLLCHELKFQTSGARRVSQSFYLSVILKSTAIKNHGVRLLRQQTLGNCFADQFGGRTIRQCLRFA